MAKLLILRFRGGESVEIDITDKLSDAGVYVIKVKAYGENEEAISPPRPLLNPLLSTNRLTL